MMPAQWEFQIGPIGAPAVGDHLWLARWLLYRIGEDVETFDGRRGISATLDPKPVKGDWNGAWSTHHFSTTADADAYGPA